MEKNVGKKDKMIRIVLAIAIFPLLFLNATPIRWFGFLSIPLLFTALTQRCGPYALMGVNTCEKD
ncbi:MAG: DUF2892 domain-containing protein [Alkalibacterium sp.]|uniref:YgaP family membrane protein n=1 Tax=Alkalibacterium sp. TaxID=1872447 RepID=UPI003970B4F5